MDRFKIFLFCTLLLVLNTESAFAQSAQAQVGYDDLVNLLGGSLEDGTGVTSAQVESEVNGVAYLANPTVTQFSNTIFVDGTGTNIGASGHATSVGARMYGSFSMASGLGRTTNPITGYGASDFLVNQTNIDNGSDPEPFDFDVANHSYILYLSLTDLTTAQGVNILQRFDFMANQGETTHCVGANNGSNTATPEFLSNSYNSISVGRTDGNHSRGTTTIYGAGRVKPEIVAPETATSFSTPLVSASAAILHEAGAGTTATRTETIRALLLSGATKDEFADWNRTTTRPLDEVFGAGELNIYNSYMSLQGGEFNGSTTTPTAPVGLNGWDYEEQIVAGNDMIYEFEVSAGTKLDQLSIALCWNMDIIDNASFFPNAFVPSENLGDLNLEFYDSSDSFLGNLLDESKSTVDNVEHIYLQDLPAGTYHLKISSDTNKDFGVAWRSTNSQLLLGDVDRNGTVNFLDVTPFIILLTSGIYQYEADIDGNGTVNFFDVTPFIILLNQ